MTDDRDDWEYDEHECWNCGGEGYVYGCSWDWQCDTYDEGEGTCLCTRRCEVCNPLKLTPEEQQQRAELQQVIADVLARDRDGTRSAETACPAPVPQDCQARAEGIAQPSPKEPL